MTPKRVVPLLVVAGAAVLLLTLRALAASLDGVVRDAASGTPLQGVVVTVDGSSHRCITDAAGRYSFSSIGSGTHTLRFSHPDYREALHENVRVEEQAHLHRDAYLRLLPGHVAPAKAASTGAAPVGGHVNYSLQPGVACLRTQSYKMQYSYDAYEMDFNTEEYQFREDNGFRNVAATPLSTFSIDVDAASYANVRRYLENGLLPPADAVRSEELINYFPYGYPQPVDGHPFSITTDVMSCPWNSAHRLVLIGLQGKEMALGEAPPNNFVFLIDVSGSMADADKLPLLIRCFRMLVDQLRPQDRVAIVVYAGTSGLVLPPTPGDRKDRILGVLDGLVADGCTAGGQGLKLAYATAHEHFRKDGNNRVILATDGDFNVGVSSTSELVRMVEKERASGIYLSVLGFGEGNLKDSRMEQIADKGNGNYYYIDGFREARKVFVSQMTGTLLAIAKDVKVQVEFNPALVAEYRLIGYENRLLNDEDFTDDRKDAGELGAGHNVTALYEIVPAGGGSHSGRPPLRYQQTAVTDSARSSGELLTVHLRYKRPEATESVELSVALRDGRGDSGGEAIRFASAVAEFAMLLRNSEFKGSASWDSALQRARGALGDDIEGYRNEFVALLRTAKHLAESTARNGE